MKLKLVALIAVALLSSGCAVQKDWVATGGSKADGTVNLAFEYSAFTSPETKNHQSVSLARSKCQAWGFKDATSFGAGEQTCVDHAITGMCVTYRVTMQMQCTGGFSYQY